MRLARHYDCNTNVVEKMQCFNQALSIYEKVLEQTSDFVDALEKQGHAVKLGKLFL